MTLKAKISGSLLLLLMLGQMFDASLFPHAHFVNGKIISLVYAHNGDYGDPGESGTPTDKQNVPCRAQEQFLSLMSSTVVASGVFAVTADLSPQREIPYIVLCEQYAGRSDARLNSLRGPPALA